MSGKPLLEGKTVMVTGAGSGIGRAAAQLFAAEGAIVAVTDKDLEAGADTHEAIRAAGRASSFTPLDVSSAESVRQAFALLKRKHPRLDGAFNNAGVSPYAVGSGDCRTHEISEESWMQMLQINLSGVWRCMKEELAWMQGQGGSIVNNSSIAGVGALARCASYVAAKHAVAGLTKTAAVEYAASGIRVNAICPGFTKTNLNAFAVGNPDLDPTPLVPMRRWGEPAEIAEQALWLLSDRASFVTGTLCIVDGGFTAQ